MEEQREQDRQERWGWFAFIYTVASGDPLKMEEASRLPLMMALNCALYKKIFVKE
jgi:hypothetical protein